ncbi:MAG: hypothetical protein Q9182_000703 [Xanthomendoza sp. 2 TL-2023]
MTSNTTGVQWPPKPPIHSRTHIFHQPSRRLPPSTATFTHPSSSDAEPVLKKQKQGGEPDWLTPPSGLHAQYKGVQSPRGHCSDSSNALTYNAPPPAIGQSDSTQPSSSPTPSLVFPLRSNAGQTQAPRNRNDPLSLQIRGTRSVGAVQTKPFIVDQPSLAPRYPSSARSGNSIESIPQDLSRPCFGEDAADFSPWRGIHAEDVLAESTIKQGFYDKIQVSQNESSTAKPTAWNSLKHKSGLHVLSSLFVSVLDQRQIHGTVTAGCTFKPPPRVTLTDSKREAWLRDLANPTIPLRRLSRTIPHGIRGRALLDHSLAKKIPTARSLWLAKCVGANEIRAFKRKGASGAFAVGGEVKWIKDWTANVEQFLDALVSTCGSDEWKENMTYGLRLANNLSAESLLDRDHYFDWLLNAINQSDLDKVLIYLLIVRSHLEELGHSRRCGRRLAESLLEQLHRIDQHASPDLYIPAKTEIVNLIKIVVVASPASFLLPGRWSTYQPMLQSVLGASQLALFENVSKRNMRLQALAGLSAESEVTTSQALLQAFDSMAPGVDLAKVALKTWEIAPDAQLLVRNCLYWSSSIYREGCARIYTAAGLLRGWSRMGIGIEAPILDFLAVDSKVADLEKGNLYRVIAELIRSKHFSVSNYLNWVIANGLLRRCGKLAEDFSPDVGLLLEIPLYGLSTHTLNLRLNLLRSIGVLIADEGCKLAQMKVHLDRKFQLQHKGSITISKSHYQSSFLEQDTLAVQLGIGHWIQQKLLTTPAPGRLAIEQPQEKLQPSVTTQSYQSHTMFQSHLLETLEDIGDFTTIVDVLMDYSKSQDLRLLTVAAVMVSHYLDVFLASGAANTIFMRLMQQHTKPNDKPGYSVLLEVLVDLAESLPDQWRNTRALRKELQRHEAKLSIAACSPISEHMAEALQTEHPGSSIPCTDDIEQLLTSGTCMDKNVVTDVFEMIWKRFELTWIDSVQSGFIAAGLLARLRLFDAVAIDEMMIRRVDEVLARELRPRLRLIWVPLVCAKIVSFEKLLSRAAYLLEQADKSRIHSELLADVVECLTIGRQKAESSISHLFYRFHSQQRRALRDSSPSIISLLQHMLRLTHNIHEVPPTRLCNLLTDPGFTGMLRTAFGSGLQGQESIRPVLRPILTSEGAVQTLGNLLWPSIDEQERNGRHGRLPVLLEHVTLLGLPLCRLYLEAIVISSSKPSNGAAHEFVSTAMKMLATTSSRTVELWESMISGLPQQQRKTIGEKAESEFFALLASTSKLQREEVRKQVDYLLCMASAADNALHNSASATSILTRMYETIAHVLASHPLSRLSKKPAGVSELRKVDAAAEVWIYEILYALVRLLNIHQTVFRTPNVSEDVITQLLVLLGLFLDHPFPVTYAYLSEDICDFLTMISDSLSPAVQARCIHILQNQYGLKHSRLDYIFAFSNAREDTWLHVSMGTANSSRQPATQHFPIRRWETMQDATPLMTENDTSISLSLFGAKKAVL